MKKLLVIVFISAVTFSCGIFRSGNSGSNKAGSSGTADLPRGPKGWMECPQQTDAGARLEVKSGCNNEPGTQPKNCIIYRAKPGMDKWEADPYPTPYRENTPDDFGWYHKRFCK